MNLGLSTDEKTSQTTKYQLWATENYPTANIYIYTTSGARPIDTKVENLMSDDSVPNPHKGKHIYNYLCQERNIRSYNNIYFKKWYQI